MVSLDVVDTDAFLEMPVSSQLLYFHLNARADDDGFISSPRKIMKVVGTNDDDLRILTSKKFVIPFDGGICVIKHWRINNFIRKDIYKETKYTNLKRTLFIRENGAYTLNENGDSVPVPDGHFQLEDIHVNDTLTTREPSIGKVRIGKVSLVKNNQADLFNCFWSAYPKKVGKGSAEKAWLKMSPDLQVVLDALEVQKQTEQWQKEKGKFIPHPATWLNGKRWEDEMEVVTSVSSKFAKYDN